ncbi:MAG: zinc ribbon domain-containing protein [Planctomycetes bacterium]|nr:zinc ribbon domain-containing protein [Planctomycetota bacterium]
MPTYDYECDACGHRFELFQSISADPEKKCPQCKKLKLRRLIGTGAAVVFKGSGFYQTDYRSDSYKKSAAADGSSSSSDSAKYSSEKSSSEKTSSKSTESTSSSSSEKKPSKKRSGDKT